MIKSGITRKNGGIIHCDEKDPIDWWQTLAIDVLYGFRGTI